MANDSRALDLLMLLQSNNMHDKASVKVIPFDNNTKITKRICNYYGAHLINPNPLWDRLGMAIYGNSEYRPGVFAWRYFRKLNAISDAETPFAFIDANTLIIGPLKDLLTGLSKSDILFGARSVKGRNFTPAATFVLNEICPEIANGFNGAFWITSPEVFELSMFRRMANYPDLRAMLTRSPEQSILSLAIVLQKRKAMLISDAVPWASPQIPATKAIADDIKIAHDGKIMYKGKCAYSIKWPGLYPRADENEMCQTIYDTVKSFGGSDPMFMALFSMANDATRESA